MHLPRGRTTDALIAISVFVFLLVLLTGAQQWAVLWTGFIPAEVSTGDWLQNPVRTLLSPIASVFVHTDILSLAFNMVFLLISGRYIEQAWGPVGLIVTYVAGAYGAALARLALTPGSLDVSIGANAALFAIIGAYFLLFGVPRAVNIGRSASRLGQILMLASIWMAIQLAFSLAAGSFEISTNIIAPMGALAAGLAVARPLLMWRYRKA